MGVLLGRTCSGENQPSHPLPAGCLALRLLFHWKHMRETRYSRWEGCTACSSCVQPPYSLHALELPPWKFPFSMQIYQLGSHLQWGSLHIKTAAWGERAAWGTTVFKLSQLLCIHSPGQSMHQAYLKVCYNIQLHNLPGQKSSGNQMV